MHSSDDLQAVLARYRPAGPPAELRARVIAGAAPPRRASEWREWLAVAAALAFTVLFYWLGMNQRTILESRFTPVPPVDQAVVIDAPSIEELPQ